MEENTNKTEEEITETEDTVTEVVETEEPVAEIVEASDEKQVMEVVETKEPVTEVVETEKPVSEIVETSAETITIPKKMKGKVKNKFLRFLRRFLLSFCIIFTLLAFVVVCVFPVQVGDLIASAYLIAKMYPGYYSADDVVSGMVKGFVEGVGNKYTIYYTPEEYAAMKTYNSGYTSGIGVTIIMVTDSSQYGADYVGTLHVEEVNKGSGAELAGIQTNDFILKVEDYYISDIGQNVAVGLIRGDVGTKVNLTIRRPNADYSSYEDINITAQRTASIEKDIVYGGILREELSNGNTIGYIAISYFANNSASQFNEVFDTVMLENPEALILDLRDNPGGDVENLGIIARHFVPDGVLMTLKANTQDQIFTVVNSNMVNIPVFVLINENSASASEILAGAIRDYGTGTLIGTTTYGKGSVQGLFEFPSGGGLRITEGKYYLPNGECIDGVGVKPDNYIEQISDEEDTQLTYAIGLINKFYKSLAANMKIS